MNSQSDQHEPVDSSTVEALVAECLERQATEGAQAVERICAAHPRHARLIRQRLRFLDDLGLVDDTVSLTRERPRLLLQDGQTLGKYCIVRELGRGGQGVVYLAVDTSLGRHVAVKFLSAAYCGGDELVRFQREGELVSRLDHPAICTVYETGDIDGLAYIAMRYIDGEPLASRLARERDRADTPRGSVHISSRLLLLEKVARALHSAHETGLVHRDMKPGNIMLTTGGDPVILDFGLARDDSGNSPPLTRSGDIMGTPAYMAPELIERDGRADRRTDGYALGVILYECLTLTLPFESPTRDGLYRAILHDAPEPLRRRNPSVSRDLEVVVSTALARNPDDRYRTALDLAEDLRRVREHEPIRARPAGICLRMRRFVERNRSLSAALIVSFALLTGGLALTLHLLDRTRDALRRSEGQQLIAASNAMLEDDPVQALALAIEGARRCPGSTSRSAVLAAFEARHERCALTGHQAGVRRARWSSDGSRILTASLDGTARLFDSRDGRELTVMRGRDAVLDARFAIDDSRIVTMSADGTARVWHAEDGSLQHVLDAASPAASSLSSNGRVRDAATTDSVAAGMAIGREGPLLTWGGRHPARLWNIAGGTLLDSPNAGIADGTRVVCGAIHAEGELAAIGDADGAVLVIDTSTGKIIHRITLRLRPTLLEFAPDGRLLAFATADSRVRLLDLDSGELHAPLGGHGGDVIDMVFSADGSLMATACQTRVTSGSTEPDSAVRVFDVRSREMRRHVETDDSAPAGIDFDPGGRRLVVSMLDGSARILDVEGDEAFELSGHRGRVLHAEFGPDGKTVVTASDDGSARIWDLGCPPALPDMLGHAGAVSPARFSADGLRVATASEDGTARIWNGITGDELAVLRGHRSWVYPVDLSPDGRHAVTASWDGTVRLWDVDSGAERHRLVSYDPSERARIGPPLEKPVVFHAAFSPDGSQVATASWDGVVRLFDATTGALVRTFHGHDAAVNYAHVTPDGSRLVSSSADGTVRVWDIASGAGLHVLEGHTADVFRLAFDSAGERLVTAAFDGTARVFRLADGVCLATLEGHRDKVWRAVFSADGRRVATASQDRTARIFDARTGKLLRVIEGHAGPVVFVDFSPDGSLIATASGDGTVRLWDSHTAAEHLVVQAGPAGATSVYFSPDGRRILFACGSGRAAIRPVDPVAAALDSGARELQPAEIAAFLDRPRARHDSSMRRNR